MHKYPGTAISPDETVKSPRIQAYSLKDPLKAFEDISDHGQRNELFLMDTFLDASGNDNNNYTFRLNNHFQGIARHLDGQHFILSGSNVFDNKAALFVFKLDSYLTKAKDLNYSKKFIRSNTVLPNDDAKLDHIHAVYNFTGKYWHAGGISFLGDILVVPLENSKLTDKKSIIVFINFRDPMKPKLYNVKIERKFAAGSASMIRLKNKHFLVAVWTEDGGHKFTFYLSNSTSINRGFGDPITVPFEDFHNKNEDTKPRFQAFQFIQNTDGSRIYIVGTDKGKIPDTDKPGKTKTVNRRFLLNIQISPETNKDKNPVLVAPKVTIFPVKEIPNGGESYNFNSVGGFYADSDDLYMYGGSTSRLKTNSNLRISEFAPIINNTQKCTDIKDAVLELYTEDNYQGRGLVLQLDREPPISDYKKIKGVERKNFNDSISSIRYIFPKNVKYRLYEDKNYNEKRKKKNYLDLVGTGKLVEIPTLNNKDLKGLKIDVAFDNKISSSRIVVD